MVPTTASQARASAASRREGPKRPATERKCGNQRPDTVNQGRGGRPTNILASQSAMGRGDEVEMEDEQEQDAGTGSQKRNATAGPEGQPLEKR